MRPRAPAASLDRPAAQGRAVHTLPLRRAVAGRGSTSGTRRVVFRCEDGEAVDVDLIDYH